MSDEHYPGEADEAAADEASCMEPITPHALTRELSLATIEEAIQRAELCASVEWPGDFARQILFLAQQTFTPANDDEYRKRGVELRDLRLSLAQQAQEIERLEGVCLDRLRSGQRLADENILLRQSLASMTADRDAYKSLAESNARSIEDKGRQLTASQARCELQIQYNAELVERIATLQATLAEREAELEKHKAMLKYSIEDECDAEQLLVAAGISDYEEGEHGEYRGLHTQIELCIKQRDTARQDAARLREALQFYATPATYFEKNGMAICKDMGQRAQNALKGA